jgi:hypothetical protein
LCFHSLIQHRQPIKVANHIKYYDSSLFGVREDVRPKCRGESGTQELRKERGRWGFTTEETDGLGDWAENC